MTIDFNRGVTVGAIITVANRKVEILPGKHTWLEAIHRANTARRAILPNSFYNDLFLGRGADGRFKPVPDEIASARPLYVGTAAVVGAYGSPLGKRVETECEYNGSRKVTIFKPSADQKALIDTVLLCDHGFAHDGTPLIQLFNTRTNKPILTEDNMLAATEVIVKFNGTVHQIKILNRRLVDPSTGVLEQPTYGTFNANFFALPNSACMDLGLVSRGSWGLYPDDWTDKGRRGVLLFNGPVVNLGMAVEAP